MPGPVSDSYDPEFSTGANAADVREAARETAQRVTDIIGSDQLKNIVAVVHGEPGRMFAGKLSEREWRIIRFCLNRFVEE